MNLSKKQINNLSKVFKKYNAVFAYLFGSQATGKTNKKSDFDFAVMLPKEYGKNKRFDIRLKMITELSELLGYKKTDLVILNDISSLLLKYTIIYEGKVIYESKQDKRIDYATYIQSEYFDFSPFLSEYNKLFLERAI
ncbi:nucleotidyltransferase domain-containing protein [Candidatus Parcubacteria bacterium]|nr:nucleotidyltransferase domain-containing protein [Candidatus Parcubacteria bacterium]